MTTETQSTEVEGLSEASTFDKEIRTRCPDLPNNIVTAAALIPVQGEWDDGVFALNNLYESLDIDPDTKLLKQNNRSAKQLICELERQLHNRRREFNRRLSETIETLTKTLHKDRRKLRDARKILLNESRRRAK